MSATIDNEKLMRIHGLIKSGNFPNRPGIANLINISTRTVSRYIKALRERFGAPVRYSIENNGFYYDGGFDLSEFICPCCNQPMPPKESPEPKEV